jgi:hypothetical protein
MADNVEPVREAAERQRTGGRNKQASGNFPEAERGQCASRSRPSSASCRPSRCLRREVEVYDGALFRGRMVVVGKTFSSYDANDQLLGIFGSQTEAMAAFNAGRA